MFCLTSIRARQIIRDVFWSVIAWYTRRNWLTEPPPQSTAHHHQPGFQEPPQCWNQCHISMSIAPRESITHTQPYTVTKLKQTINAASSSLKRHIWRFNTSTYETNVTCVVVGLPRFSQISKTLLLETWRDIEHNTTYEEGCEKQEERNWCKMKIKIDIRFKRYLSNKLLIV